MEPLEAGSHSEKLNSALAISIDHFEIRECGIIHHVRHALLRQGGQQTLEHPEKPWILFAPGKITWKTLKLHPNPEKLCSEADFPFINFWPCSAVAFFIPVMQGRRIYEVIRR